MALHAIGFWQRQGYLFIVTGKYFNWLIDGLKSFF